ISITHTKPTPLHTVNDEECTLTQSSELPTCTAALKTSSRDGDKQAAWLSDTRGPITLASSMTCLTNPTIESLQASEPSTHTLPRRRSHTSTPVKLNKGSNNNLTVTFPLSSD
uniref:Uncharacterized protein n=1 Tax=Ciona savignyi TaxID=51511 RepID=H2YJU9_CIOSA